MSQENVEVLRAALAALNAGDMHALRGLYHPDAIARPPEGWPEPGPFVGREAIIRQLEQMRATWDTEAVEPVGDFIDVGDRVVLRYVWHGIGHGPESNVEVTCVVTVRNGKMLTIDYFWDHAEALEAVGLSEQTMSHQNVELVRRLFPPDGTDLVPLVRDEATWTTRFGEMEALIESDYAVAWIAEGQRMIEATGEADSRRGWLDWLEPWDTYRFQNEGIIPVGDTVLVLLRVQGRMAGTQNEVEMISASIYLVRDGRVARVEHYADRAAALQAVGLSEQHPHADS